MIPELFQKFFGSVTRYLLIGVAGYLVQKGVISEDLSTELLAAAAVGIPALIWGLWSKYKDQLHFLAALKLPANATKDDAKKLAKTDAVSALE